METEDMNRATEQNQYRKIVLAIGKYLTGVTSITLAGTAYTTAQLVSFYTNLIALADAASAAKAALATAVKANDEGHSQSEAVQNAFKSFILSMFAGQEGPLADFTFSPRKVATVSAATKAEAAAKRKATLAAHESGGTGTATPPAAPSTGGSAPAEPVVSGSSTPKTS
jgi:hypothetical protein